MKKIVSLVAIMLMLIFNTITALASPMSEIEQTESIEIQEDLFEFDENSVKDTGTQVYPNASTRSFHDSDFSGGYLHKTETLTEEDIDDYYFFSVTSTKFLSFKINSPNADYHVELGLMDWDEGMYYATTIKGNTAAGSVWVQDVPSGDYALHIYSDGTVGDSYTVAANTLCPSNVTGVYYESDDLSTIVTRVGTSTIYQNNMNVSNQLNSVLNKPVAFFMEDSWPVYPSGTEYYTHDIDDGKIKSVSTGSFYSNMRSIKNALWVKLDVGTLWTYTHSIVNNGSTLSFIDLAGRKTPRRFDSWDVGGEFGDHYLIYDMDTGKYVDFYSLHNVFFASGGQVLKPNSRIFLNIWQNPDSN